MHEPILDALRRGAHDEAMSAAREAIAAAPDDAHAWRLLALAQVGAGDHEPAMDSIQRALRLEPDNADLHFQHAGLLLGGGDASGAGAALDRSTGLDPNQFGAYVMQAQLALGRGDLREAARLQKLAARIEPRHPWVRTIEGMLALRGGNVAAAQSILGAAAAERPDDPQVQLARGFAFLAGDNLAFAEQSFRRVIDAVPRHGSLRSLLAEVLRRQGRHDEAADQIDLLLADPARASPALRRQAGELRLAAGDAARALPQLEAALQEGPGDRRTLSALLDAWQATARQQEARGFLDRMLVDHPGHDPLWQARLALDAGDPDAMRSGLDAWLAARPESVQALETRMRAEDAAGDPVAALASARRILELEPGRTLAEMRLLDHLLQTDPAAAVERIEGLVAQADDQARASLQRWLGLAQHVAGRPADAIASWSASNAFDAPRRLPLYTPGVPDCAPMPEATRDDADGQPPTAFLWGPPGSGVEDVAAVIDHAGYPVRDDRLGASPPADPLQNPDTALALREGRASPTDIGRQWSDALPARGIHDGIVVDWLPWWDNGLLDALRSVRPHGIVVFALRDPRDMLLDWLAFGGVVPWAATTSGHAASWLTITLAHVAELHERGAQPHHLVRTDHAHDDLSAFAADIGGGIGLDEIRVPPPSLLAPRRFAPGAWREYREALAPEFALLTPVAVRLGYAAD